MRVSVATRDRGGPTLAAAPQAAPRYEAPATDAVLAEADQVIARLVHANAGHGAGGGDSVAAAGGQRPPA